MDLEGNMKVDEPNRDVYKFNGVYNLKEGRDSKFTREI